MSKYNGLPLASIFTYESGMLINLERNYSYYCFFLSVYTYNSTYPDCTDMERILLYNAPKMPKMMERSIES